MQKGLGKGLGALFTDIGINDIDEKEEVKKEKVTVKKEAIKSKVPKKKENEESDLNRVIELKITDVEPNVDQPRKVFDNKKLGELTESIKAHGVIQPILVKKNKYGYEIIAGERRWRAAKLAGLNKIPAIIKEYDEKKLQEVALIENIQRENLNAIEQAQAFKLILEEYNITQEDLARTIGKSRSAIANMMRLLTLSESIQKLVIKGDLSEAQARYLLAVKDEKKREELAQKVVESGLTVKQLENIVYGKPEETKKVNSSKNSTKNNAVFGKIEDRLNEYFMTKVNLKANKDKGKIVIEYYSNDDLNRILEKLDIDI